MAYCKKCRAYIPDGQTKCLACGYDEAAEREAKQHNTKNEGGFASEYAKEKEEMERRRREREEQRGEYEQRRREQQEENRRWAEQERRRRRESGQSANEANYSSSRNKSVNPIKHKELAGLSYLGICFIIPMLLCGDDNFARFHVRQGVGLFAFGIICDVVSAIIPIGWLLSIFRVYCIFKGIGNAHYGKMEPLPYIGKYIDR